MKIALGLSGGVDSAVAALLLSQAGHQVTGVTMRLWKPGRYKGGAEGSCFGPGEEKNIETAAALATKLGIPYRVFDCTEKYEREVIAYFRDTYLAGLTPNPCVRCNELVKFGLLPRLAIEAGLEFDHFATGHYARIEESGGRFRLLRGVDTAKDQSYFLYRLSQEQLSRTLFPLGMLTKAEIRAIAARNSLEVANRPDSQDFCSGGTDELIGRTDEAGDIVDASGKILGRHNGYWHFTPGQRKGIGIGGAGEPYYVLETDSHLNRVVVGRRDEAARRSFAVEDVNWVSIAETAAPFECMVKVRSAGKLLPAVYERGTVTVDGGVFGVAPGQSAVCYDPASSAILCGGIIAR